MVATAVESSTLTTVAYDPADRMLQLEFRSGGVYCYLGVPPGVYRDLMAANSNGAYFNRNIRGRFPFYRMDGGL
jgi:hypothetical protein